MISRIPNEDSYINTIRILMQNHLVEDLRDIRIFAVALSAISEGLPLPDDLGTRPVAYTIRGLQDERTHIVSSLMDGEQVDRFQELFHRLVGEKACQLDRFLETTVNKDPIDILRASLPALPGSVISNSIKEALFNDWLQSNLTVENLLGMLESPLSTHCSKGMISRFSDAFLKVKPSAEELRVALCRIPPDLFPKEKAEELFDALLDANPSARDLSIALGVIPSDLFPEEIAKKLFDALLLKEYTVRHLLIVFSGILSRSETIVGRLCDAFLARAPTAKERQAALIRSISHSINRFPEITRRLCDAFLAGDPTAEELRQVLTCALPALFPEGMAKKLFDALLEVADTEHDLRTALCCISIALFPEGMASRLFEAYQEKFPQNAERLKIQLNARGLDVEIKK